MKEDQVALPRDVAKALYNALLDAVKLDGATGYFINLNLATAIRMAIGDEVK